MDNFIDSTKKILSQKIAKSAEEIEKELSALNSGFAELEETIRNPPSEYQHEIIKASELSITTDKFVFNKQKFNDALWARFKNEKKYAAKDLNDFREEQLIRAQKEINGKILELKTSDFLWKEQGNESHSKALSGKISSVFSAFVNGILNKPDISKTVGVFFPNARNLIGDVQPEIELKG